MTRRACALALLVLPCPWPGQAGLSQVRLSDGKRDRVLADLRARRNADRSFSVIDLGPAMNPWSREVIDAIVDRPDAVGWLQDCWPSGGSVEAAGSWSERSKACCARRMPDCFDDSMFTFERCCHEASGEPRGPLLRFPADLSDPKGLDSVLAYVEKVGKFDMAICTYVIEDIGRPQTVLSLLPRIAKAGYIAIPSKFHELAFKEVNYTNLRYRGSIHHRWIFTVKDGVLLGLPKISFLDADQYFDDFIDTSKGVGDLSFWWNETLPYEILNGDFLGPDIYTIVKMYREAVSTDDFGPAPPSSPGRPLPPAAGKDQLWASATAAKAARGPLVDGGAAPVADFAALGAGRCAWTDTLPGDALGNAPHSILLSVSSVGAILDGRQWLLKLGQSGVGAHHWLWTAGSEMQFGTWSNGAAAMFHSVDMRSARVIAAVHDGSSYAVYINGAEVLRRQATFDITTSALSLGEAPIRGESGFDGCVAEARVFRRALREGEVALVTRDMLEQLVRPLHQLDPPPPSPAELRSRVRQGVIEEIYAHKAAIARLSNMLHLLDSDYATTSA